MYKEPPRILAVNPGSRYIGIAVFRGADLLDWDVKVTGGATAVQRRMACHRIMADYFEMYRPNILAIKQLHPSRSSLSLDQLVKHIESFCRRRRVTIRRYSIKELEALLCPRLKITKYTLASIVANKHPALLYDLQRESQYRNPYRIRMFEAVALASACWHEIENK